MFADKRASIIRKRLALLTEDQRSQVSEFMYNWDLEQGGRTIKMTEYYDKLEEVIDQTENEGDE